MIDPILIVIVLVASNMLSFSLGAYLGHTGRYK